MMGQTVIPGRMSRPENVKTIHSVVMSGEVDLRAIEDIAPAIQMILNELQDEFRTDAGLPLDKAQLLKNGYVWADGPSDVDALILLALAANLLEFVEPRDQWDIAGARGPQKLPHIRQVTPPGAGSR